MGPIYFDPYAADLTTRARTDLKGEVLELACGTGRLTQPLLAALPQDARLMATDLNLPMIEHARRGLPDDQRLEMRPADVMALPFMDESFDVALCQFGVMFFPDKRAAAAEVRRVLRRGAPYHFNVWGSHAENESPAIVHRLMREVYPEDPPDFYEVPWSYHDPATIRADLEVAGFRDVTVTPVELITVAESARHVAIALVRGTPGAGYIAERGGPSHDEVIDRLTERLAEWGGASPCQVRNKAIVVRATA
ncbi:MAG: class I SAM-dependent methyltransferase [Candidatus Eisenbacteria bacterium]